MEKNISESYKMASLGTLTAGVCHEVLNPLNIISSYAQLLLTDTKRGFSKRTGLEKDSGGSWPYRQDYRQFVEVFKEGRA